MARAPSLCMVVHAYYPLAEPRVQREAWAARDAGYDVTVLALRAAGEAPHEIVDDVRVHRVPLSHRRGAGPFRMLYEYVAFTAMAGEWLARSAIARPFDLVHVHAPPDFLVLAALVARLRGAKVVLDIHDLSSHMLEVRIRHRGWLVSRAPIWVERLASAIADAVVTVHEPYRRELMEHGVPPGKVHVVMNSVDEALVEGIRPAGREQTSSFTVAYHGTVTWWYGIDLIVDAVSQLRDEGLEVRALILGDGDALPALRELVTQRRLGGHVHLSERYLPIEEALERVAAADCGVIPNRPSEINRFALSSKLFEYVALGLPIVVAELDTLTAHFGPEEVTFFSPGDAGSLANAIRWVCEHREDSQHKVERARARAVEYSWARWRQTLLGLYRQLTDTATPNLPGSR
jgi:glycosyltransferase involved in cell wall biosynthesis